MPTNRKRTGRTGGGIVTEKAVQMYREGLAMPRGTTPERQQRWAHSRNLHAELRVDTSLPDLLEPSPVFLLAVPDEAPYRESWADLKAALEARLEESA